jgi:hypothetical protein
MPRPDVRMTPAELKAFLAAKQRAVVGTLDAAGAPDGEPAGFTWADGVALLVVQRGGPTHRNLTRDARLVCSLEEFPSYQAIRGVTLHGRAIAVGEEGERTTFRLEPSRIESFDFRKIPRA